MGGKQVFDHSLRACGKRFLSSLKASNRYSEGYLDSLETTIAMAAQYAEEQGWPDVRDITTEVHRGLLAYLQDRVRWFGERTYAEPRKLSKGHINAQYRRLNRFFNWLVERGPNYCNPMSSISAPKFGGEEGSRNHRRPDAGPAHPRCPRPRQDTCPPLSLGLRPGASVRFWGYSRPAERNRQAAT